MAGNPRPVHADQGGSRGGHEFREHEFHREQFRDSRYHHDHYYPPRGYHFNVLPPHPRLIVHGGRQFYFSGGIWYRPVEGRYVVVRPPVGIFVPFLPPFYTRVWVGVGGEFAIQRPLGSEIGHDRAGASHNEQAQQGPVTLRQPVGQAW